MVRLVLCVEGQRLGVVGIGKGTKKLNDFLDCTKVRVLYIDASSP